MITREPLPFIKNYLDQLNNTLKNENTFFELSLIQKLWLGFCLMGILVTNSVCWAKFERLSLKTYTKHGISWMFRHSKIPWDKLLMSSVKVILKRYGLTKGVLIIDDKDLSRSKNAKKIHRLHKIKDKKTGGYFLGQNIVLLYLVTDKISIPVGFKFYSPDPALKAWQIERKAQQQTKIPRKQRTPKPERSPEHPKKYELALQLLNTFKEQFPWFKVTAVLADCLYGHRPFIEGITKIWENIQVITKMRKDQNIRCGGKEHTCESYFKSYPGWGHKITIRGREKKEILAGGGRLYVPSHEAKRFVVAMKYENEMEYRYLIASNLSWNMKEIMELFTIRWLVECFFEDWACYQGFCSMAKQCGVEGSERPLILSLLFDHCFFFETQQQINIENNDSLATFGSLLEKTRAQALCHFIQELLDEESPKPKIQELVNLIDETFELKPSKQHFNGISILLEPIKMAV
jgi:hypothetical protein